MIDTIINEYVEGDYAIRTIEVTFFSIPIYKSVKRRDLESFNTVKSQTKIKGFV